MLSLDSQEWCTLQDAYGYAHAIPALLTQLESYPVYESWQSEPYFSLTNALCHQGDVFSASYAAVPHFVRLLSKNPLNAHWALYSFPACIEQCRLNGNAPEIPEFLSESYFSSLAEIPRIVAAAAEGPWDELRCRVLLATVAVVKGHPQLSEAIDMLDPKTLDGLFKQWRLE